MKKRYSILLLVLLCAMSRLFGQGGLNKYRITFTDKNNSPYSVQDPSAYLSQRAIQRRERYNIPISVSDLPVNPQYIDSVVSTGVQLICKSKWLNSIVVQTSDTFNFSLISNFTFVKSIDTVYNHRFSTGRYAQPNNKFEKEEQLDAAGGAFDYGKANNQIKMLNIDFLHKSGYEGQGEIIAIIDAGFDNANNVPALSHLFTNGQILYTWDYVDRESNVYDDYSHGTYVLSCLAAETNGVPFGTAPEASYILLRSEDVYSESQVEEDYWAAAAEYADSAGADVTSTSLGYTTFDDTITSHTYNDLDGKTTFITRAAEMAASKGMLVVNAAGNEGQSAWHYISAPADGDSVFTVGAVDSLRQIADFSSRGPTADGRLKPNVCAQGKATAIYAPDGNVYAGNGTSFATPLIAGACACLWQAFPNKNNMEIEKAVEASADHYNNPDDNYGYGVPSFSLAYLNLSGINISNDNEDQVLKMYPIPPVNKLSFYFYSSSDQTINLSLYDVNGKNVYDGQYKMYENSIRQITVPFSSYAAGLYFLRINTDKKSYFYKIPYAKQ